MWTGDRRVDLDRLTKRLERALKLARNMVSPPKDEESLIIYLTGHFLIAVDELPNPADRDIPSMEDQHWSRDFLRKLIKPAGDLVADRRVVYRGYVLELVDHPARTLAGKPVTDVTFRIVRAS